MTSPTTFHLIEPKNFLLTNDKQILFTQLLTYVKEIQSFSEPQIFREQYSLPNDLIAFILTLISEDLLNKNVIDFGCGTGRLTIPISKFFAARVLGVDIDYKSVKSINIWKEKEKLLIDLLITPIEFLELDNWSKMFDITVMNPPFGTKRRRIDVIFLEKALIGSKTVISIHKSNNSTRKLLKSIGNEYGKENEILATISFPIPALFPYHRKTKHFVTVDLLKFWTN